MSDDHVPPPGCAGCGNASPHRTRRVVAMFDATGRTYAEVLSSAHRRAGFLGLDSTLQIELSPLRDQQVIWGDSTEQGIIWVADVVVYEVRNA